MTNYVIINDYFIAMDDTIFEQNEIIQPYFKYNDFSFHKIERGVPLHYDNINLNVPPINILYQMGALSREQSLLENKIDTFGCGKGRNIANFSYGVTQNHKLIKLILDPKNTNEDISYIYHIMMEKITKNHHVVIGQPNKHGNNKYHITSILYDAMDKMWHYSEITYNK
jgi:hypothetical protein